jgi:UDP-galactopyranose mutase
MEKHAVVAGAGIWGCTVARRLAEAGCRVTVLEKRSVTGGNVRCETDPETGIEIHSYGSHIFHTGDVKVWDFIRRFTEFNGYQHKVLAQYRGKRYFLPLGLPLLNKFFDVELEPSEVSAFMADEKRSAAVFDAFFRGYTSKQWGRPPEEIDPTIINACP